METAATVLAGLTRLAPWRAVDEPWIVYGGGRRSGEKGKGEMLGQGRHGILVRGLAVAAVY